MGLLFGMILYPVISETKRHKMVVWGLRIAAIPLAIVLYVVLIRNFYKSDPYAGQSHEFSYPPFEPLTGSLSQRVLGVAISHASPLRQITIAKGK